MFDEDETSCRRCGADRKEAVKRELRDLCYTYTGEEPEDDEIARLVKPVFLPKWGKPQWYEGEVADGTGSDEGEVDQDDEEEEVEEEVEDEDVPPEG
jgi:hypothetical protein